MGTGRLNTTIRLSKTNKTLKQYTKTLRKDQGSHLVEQLTSRTTRITKINPNPRKIGLQESVKEVKKFQIGDINAQTKISMTNYFDFIIVVERNMQIIVAGCSKTGTKSLNAALTWLGYNVYDFMEHVWFHGNDWKNIIDEGTGSTKDFKRMYKDVDVVLDAPAFSFWEEIHQAFPEAKIILSIRDEDSWYQSCLGQIDELDQNWFLHVAMAITPTGWKFFKQCQRISRLSWGSYFVGPFRLVKRNEMLARRMYRQHCSYVMQKAPKDKLLVYSIKEGWAPLCEFLGKDIPERSFPHENVGGTALKEFLKSSPVMQQIKKEFIMSLSIIFGFILAAGYTLSL